MSTRSVESSEAGSLPVEGSSSVSKEEHNAANPSGASKIKYASITLVIFLYKKSCYCDKNDTLLFCSCNGN